MWTSSISSRSPSSDIPNSYLVSTRISPAAAATCWPRLNSSRAIVVTCSQRRASTRPRSTTSAHVRGSSWTVEPAGGFVVGVTSTPGSAVFFRSPSGKW